MFIYLFIHQGPVHAESIAGIKPKVSITAAYNHYGFEPILHVDYPGPYEVSTRELNSNVEIRYICNGPTDIKLFSPGDFTFIKVYAPDKNHKETLILKGKIRNDGNKTVTFER
ncbi:MAG: hypothetical protein HGB18_01250 [Candidatus Moranbacteria bacterium]|nr:hypothetical protein [Candidatus Moranbacteria bacterium]